jgi:predicted SAM-dependent methyltransferase
MLKLNLGCGPQVVNGWVNVDYALGARLAAIPVLSSALRHTKVFRVDWDPNIRIHDLTKPLPWEDGTVDACYSSHTVEHMSRDQGAALVREAYRVLKPGGVLRIVVPDLVPIVDRYRNGEMPADRVVEQLGVLYGTDKHGLRRTLAPLIEFPHKCMYDTAAMIRLLESAGFVARARPAFDSEIDDIRAIELQDRTVEAVIVEGKKPRGNGAT